MGVIGERKRTMATIKYENNGKFVEIEVTNEQAELLITLDRQDASARRKARRHNEASIEQFGEDTGWEPIDTAPTPDEAAEKHEEQERLSAVIACLDAKQWEIVWLYYYEEKNFTEIAAILSIDRRNVARRLKTIYKKLKNIF